MNKRLLHEWVRIFFLIQKDASMSMVSGKGFPSMEGLALTISVIVKEILTSI